MNFNSLLGIGIYTIPEASRYTGVRPRTIRRWVSGYRRKRGKLIKSYTPVWNSQLEPLDGEIAIGFLDLLEIRFVERFLGAGVSWKTIRLVAERAMDLYQWDHPFTTKRFRSDGRNIFAEIVKASGEASLLNLRNNQTAFHEILSPALYESLDFEDEKKVMRWWPMGRKKSVVMDPRRAFGHPIVSKEGVPTTILAAAFKAEESIERVAKWYEVAPRSVKDAIEYEGKLAA